MWNPIAFIQWQKYQHRNEQLDAFIAAMRPVMERFVGRFLAKDTWDHPTDYDFVRLYRRD